MRRVEILSVPVEHGRISYYAMAGKKRSFGHTAGEALDLLTSQFPVEEVGTLVIVQSHQPDRFFDANQQRRLGELMQRWRTARDQGRLLSTGEQAELEKLADTELLAAAARAEEMLFELDG